MKVMLEDKVLKMVSAYDPQMGCEKIQKEGFWQDMDEVMQGISKSEDIMI